MTRIASLIAETDAPTHTPTETIDVRDEGPPEPLRRTLELLPELDDDTVLVQRNDRVPQFLFPKLEDRGYRYETKETEVEAVTVIWTESE